MPKQTKTETQDTATVIVDNLRKRGVLMCDKRVAAIERALCTRGPSKGRLKAKCPTIWGPNADDWAAAAWLGMQPNPWKMKFSGAFLLGEAKEFLLELSKFRFPVSLDKDLEQLKQLGVV